MTVRLRVAGFCLGGESVMGKGKACVWGGTYPLACCFS